MKFLFDLFPILLFFIAFKVYGIYTATAVAIVASIAQTAIHYIRHRKLETMHLVTLGMIVVFGGATLIFQNEDFIKWKPTAINWLIGIAFFVTMMMKKPLVKRMMSSAVSLPDQIWKHLNIAWGLFFIVSGTLNLYVAFNYDLDTWVNFKTFGLLGLTVLFIIAQSLYMARFIKEETVDASSDRQDAP